MKKLHTLFAVLGIQFIFSTNSFADFPKNDLDKEDIRFRRSTSMTEAKFNALIDRVDSVYAPIFAGHGATLVWQRNWDDATVNAYASQNGNNWQVAMFGGLARRPEVTEDGFVLVMCHEIGHHLGGFPLYESDDWAASEGQSDYFASETCAKKLWKSDLDVNAEFREKANPVAKAGCDEIWSEPADQNLCYRISMAGYSLADLLTKIGDGGDVAFDTPSTVVVNSSMTSHPPAQCRLDTYWAGALCERSIPDDLIPGRSFSEDPEALASKHSCTSSEFYFKGIRPLCWFHPKLPSLLTLKDLVWESLSGSGSGAIQPGESFNLKAVLENHSSADLHNLNLKLSSPVAGVSMSVDEAVLSEVLSQSSSSDQDRPFTVSFKSDLACGAEIKLDLGVELNSKRKGVLSYLTKMGTRQTSEVFATTEPMKIPDLQSAVSTLDVKDFSSASALNLEMQIQHTFFRDLKYKLESPSGRVYDFTAMPPENNGTFVLKATLKTTEENLAGSWKLTVSDNVARDEGELKYWNLQFESYVCR